MAGSFVGSAGAVANSVTLPSHLTNDLLLIAARRFGSTTPPDLPSGWTNAVTGNDGSNSYRIGYKIAASSSEVSGTWTNASQIIAHVYRGTTTTIGAVASTSGSGTPATIPALTFISTNPWVFGLYEGFSTFVPTIAGMTNRQAIPASDNLRIGSYDTAAPVASWAGDSFTATVGEVWATAAVEIPVAADGATPFRGLLLMGVGG